MFRSGRTSLATHEAAPRRIEQAGGRMIGVPQLFCELQCDWHRAGTVPVSNGMFIKTDGAAAIHFSYDGSEWWACPPRSHRLRAC